MPFDRFGEPGDPAKLIGRLALDEARWIAGQVLPRTADFSLYS